jgi:tRNA(fMet)-specific endonuclease VapC
LNKAILDTDIFSEMIKGVDQTVAANAKTYRRAFGHYTIAAVTVMEIVQGYQQKQATRQLQAFLTALPSQEVLSFEEADAELAGRIARLPSAPSQGKMARGEQNLGEYHLSPP